MAFSFQIDHIVLGKGPPGGSWHRMDPNLRTLSLSGWMSLPGLDYATWNITHPPKPDNCSQNNTQPECDRIKLQESNDVKKSCQKSQTSKQYCDRCRDLMERQPYSSNNGHAIDTNNNNMQSQCTRCSRCHKRFTADLVNSIEQNNLVKRNGDQADRTSPIVPTRLSRRVLSVKRQTSREVETRALVSRVAEYYASYVEEMGLARFFQNDAAVSTIQAITHSKDGRWKNARWLISGHRANGKSFHYVCRNVVLANGVSDLANRLGLRGENHEMTWIKHDLPQLESTLKRLTDEQRSSKSTLTLAHRSGLIE